MPTSDRQAIPPQTYRGLNLTPAINSLLLTRYEYHSREEVYSCHYDQTDELLRDLARKNPSSLTAISSQPAKLDPNWPGFRVNAYLLLPDQSVIFIGCVCDRLLTNQLYKEMLKLCRSVPTKVAAIQRIGKIYISRDSWLCAITTLSDRLTSPILTEALRRYFDRYSPGLTKPPISWLNDTNQPLSSAIHKELRSRAAALANPPIESLSEQELDWRWQHDDFDDTFPRHLPPDETPKE